MKEEMQYTSETPSRDAAGRTENILTLVKANEQVIMQGIDLASQVTEVYAESQRLNAQVKMTEQWSQVEMAKTAAKFYATKELIERTFGERHQALSSHYKALDHAIECGDRELIVAAMHQISTIVTSSPLADFQTFVERFNDKSQPLLDF